MSELDRRKRKKQKYRDDPEYRAKVIDGAKRTQNKLFKSKTYRLISRLDKLIYARRQSISTYLTKVATLERQLIRLIAKRDELRMKYKMEKEV